jgi:hypothetical protein
LMVSCCTQCCQGTVLASFLQSFVFATSLFTAPARPLLTRAAAAERLAGALRGTAQRCDVALRRTAVSGVPIRPFSDQVSCLMIGTTLLICTNSSVLISVLRFLRAIDYEMVGIERG